MARPGADLAAKRGARLLGEVETGGAGAERGDQLGLGGDLGLDVVGKPVGVVAGEDLAARHGLLRLGGPHLLDVVVVLGIDNGGDVEVGLAVPATEVELGEHAGDVVCALLDSVGVANPLIRELDTRLLGVADLDGLDLLVAVASVGSEVDHAGLVVQGLEGDAGGVGDGRGGGEGQSRGSEMHLGRLLGGKKDCGCGFVRSREETV